jgi:hypothetical protein
MLAANPGPFSDFGAGQFVDRLRQHRAARKIVGMDSAVDRIDFNCGHNVKARLLKAQPEASSTRK